MILRTALSDWARSRVKARRQRNVPRPKLPTRAELRYVGAMALWAQDFERLVREAVNQHWPEIFKPRTDGVPGCSDLPEAWYSLDQRVVCVGYLAQLRTDGLKIGPLHLGKVRRQLGPVQVALNQRALQIPLTTIGNMVQDHITREATRVIGLKNKDILPLGHTVDQWRYTNSRLITGMSDEMLTRVADTLSAYDGARVEDTRDELESTFGMTRARASLIARDQTLKLNAQLTEDVHQSVGITEYTWSTSRDQSVRKDHQILEGVRCSYRNPPVVDQRTGATGNPGTYFQCRCIAIPILPELE